VVAIASMILPGLSGSFVLILMGNYQLIFLRAVPEFNFKVIVPIAIGSVIGLLALSHAIAFVLSRWRDQTIALLTGFILGSLAIIWPWKDELYLLDSDGSPVLKNGRKIVQDYQRFLPDFDQNTVIAIVLMLVGVAVIYLIEKMGESKPA
jgi:putative membrane protein